MTLKPLLRALPPGFEIVLADIGSAGGLKDRWAPARPAVSAMLFEPRDGGEPRAEGRDMLYPVALGPEKGRALLNLTALPNMSSTLQPNRPLLETFRKKGAHTQITGTLEMPVDTLDAVAAQAGRGVDAIKVDTQGSEIGILEGARRCLAETVILAEIEVSFFERYEGQALFGDIETLMRAAGFELLDLYRLKRYRRLNRHGIGNVSLGAGQRAGRLAYGDALFFLKETTLLERIRHGGGGETLALKAILGLLVYGKADMAARLFDETADLMDPARRARLARYFGSIGRRFLRHNSIHHVLDYLARHV
ncbi:FkbM family methyltransferase [Allosphingosinicella humi]